MITSTHIIEEFDRIIVATETLFRLVPDDKVEWMPYEGMLTAGQQMLHIAASLKAYADACRNGEWPFQSIDEILKKNHETASASSALALRLLRRTADDFRKMVLGFTPEELEVSVSSPQFGRAVPRRKLILFCIEHHLSHKAELFMYLRLLGVPVGSKELYFGLEH